MGDVSHQSTFTRSPAAAATAPPAATPSRILALDIFRGMTIALMIIVNTPGNGSVAWGPLRHASWHGFTPTDLVFPSFLFAIGTSAWFSLKRFGHQPGGAALAKIWRRTAILFLIGVFMWHVPGFVASLVTLTPGAFLTDLVVRVRILGVLQRLAICYGIGATLALYLSRRALVAVGGGILLLYWALMWAFGQGPDPYSLQTNAALRLDTWVLGPAHLYHGERVDGVRFAFDPEGILSTLPAIVTFIIGYLTGMFLDRTRDRRQALVELLPTACLLIAAGFIWSEWFGFPINKKLWTSSYTLYAGGWSMLVLGLVHVGRRRPWQGGAADVLQRLRTEPAAGVHHVGSRGGLPVDDPRQPGSTGSRSPCTSGCISTRRSPSRATPPPARSCSPWASCSSTGSSRGPAIGAASSSRCSDEAPRAWTDGVEVPEV